MILNKAALLWCVPLILLVVFLGAKRTSVSNHSPALEASVDSEKKGIQPLVFFEKDHFYEGVLYAKEHTRPFTHTVTGGIVPHHLLPSFIIADFFHYLTFQKPPTVILIGPNHYEKGEYKVASSDFDWQTPFGVVEPNMAIISELKENRLLGIENHMATNEHSVAGIMPYIKYYLPDATVVPLMLKRSIQIEELHTLADSLARYSENGAVIVASVDFSHYLSSEEAQQKDKVTLKTIRDFDYRQLVTLNNDYLDSPPSIALLLATMQKRGTVTSELLHHTNSGILQNDPFQETTSYISLAFH